MVKRARKKRWKINYREGSCFFVPLRKLGIVDGKWVWLKDSDGSPHKEGFGRGIVARMDGRGSIFAYFFAPKLLRAEGRFGDVTAQSAKLLAHCGDLGLLNGEWPLAGVLEGWNREEWPFPPSYREDEFERKAWLTYYDEDTIDVQREEPVKFVGYKAEFKRRVALYGMVRKRPVIKIGQTIHPYDSLLGYGAAEIALSGYLV